MTAPTADESTEVWTLAAEAFVDWRDHGRPDGLDRLVHLLTPTLWHIVRAYDVRHEEAADVVQSTWLNLVRNAGSVRDPQAVWRWLTTTARREAWRVNRTGRREEPLDTAIVDRFTPPDPDPAIEVLASDTGRRLWHHVAALPERCRRLLRVIAFEDRPDYAALSAELAMKPGSIGPTRGRCLDKLRRLLGDDPQWSNR
jgi:RNA polymerase sigma factor (sigma-70 family)